MTGAMQHLAPAAFFIAHAYEFAEIDNSKTLARKLADHRLLDLGNCRRPDSVSNANSRG
jgi:hypothetical protein